MGWEEWVVPKVNGHLATKEITAKKSTRHQLLT